MMMFLEELDSLKSSKHCGTEGVYLERLNDCLVVQPIIFWLNKFIQRCMAYMDLENDVIEVPLDDGSYKDTIVATSRGCH